MKRKTLCYLGIDPSLRHTGIAVVLGRERIRMGYLDNPEKGGDRCGELAAWRDDLWREVVLCVGVDPVNVALIEGYSYASRGNATLLQAEIGGIARAMLADRWTVIEVPPGTWRALTLNRYGIKPGKGTKADEERYLSDIWKRFRLGFETTHEAEAYLMCRAADAALNGDVPLTPGGKKLRDALLAVWQGR